MGKQQERQHENCRNGGDDLGPSRAGRLKGVDQDVNQEELEDVIIQRAQELGQVECGKGSAEPFFLYRHRGAPRLPEAAGLTGRNGHCCAS